MNTTLQLAGHLFLTSSLSPLFFGVIAKTKALIAGRQGPPLLQTYWDLAKFFRKDMVVSRSSTWIFRAGPLVGLVVPAYASLFLPLGPLHAPLSFAGDMILFAALFALARFFTVLAALDTGGSFEGMGAAREATFSCLTEPTLFVVFMVLVRISGSFSLDGMLTKSPGAVAAGAPLSLAALCLFIVLLAENCRIPFDDPATHLELTMIHEVIVLDHSGPDLACITWGASMKLFVMATLFTGCILPPPSGRTLADLAIFAVLMLVTAMTVGLVESCMARLRLLRIPQLLVGTCLLSFFALILLLR